MAKFNNIKAARQAFNEVINDGNKITNDSYWAWANAYATHVAEQAGYDVSQEQWSVLAINMQKETGETIEMCRWYIMCAVKDGDWEYLGSWV